MVLQVVRLQTDKFISALSSVHAKLDSKIILDLVYIMALVGAGTLCGFGAALFSFLLGCVSCSSCLLPITLIIKSVKQAISDQSDLACDQALFIIILIVKGLLDYRLQDRNKVPY